MKFLEPLLASKPKSYCLWHHRGWVIEQTCLGGTRTTTEGKEKGKGKEEHKAQEEEEKEEQEEQEVHALAVVSAEIYLCGKMLDADERNFHCWNYRLWVVDTFLTEMVARASDKEPEAIFGEH